MDRLLIKGRYSTYTNSAGQENIPIEQKRDIREDASWQYYTLPGTPFFKEQAADIYYEHSQREVYLTRNDIILKQMGFPTHPITQALLTAEYPSKVDSAIVKTHGKKGWIEKIASSLDVRKKPLRLLTDDELITILFRKFKLFTKYGEVLEQHFRLNTGEDLIHHLDYWADGRFTKRDNLVRALREPTISAYKSNTVVDVTEIISKNFIDFSTTEDTSMIGERAAFGGIQEVGIMGFLTDEKINNRILGIPTIPPFIKVEYRFLLKDWFGVDEEDVYKNQDSTQMDREGLAAFWILQHQRRYKPFINIITYKQTEYMNV